MRYGLLLARMTRSYGNPAVVSKFVEAISDCRGHRFELYTSIRLVPRYIYVPSYTVILACRIFCTSVIETTA